MRKHVLTFSIITVFATTLQMTYAREGDLAGVANLKESVIKDYGLKEYVHVSKNLPHSETNEWKLVCTMPYNCHFQPWIHLESPKGKVIKFNSSNPLVLYMVKTEDYTTEAGDQKAEAKNWISGEGAIYTIPAGVTVQAVQYRETGFDTTFAGSFECNDNDYNILWQKAARTAYVCMREWFFDCPDRERVGFWGDGTPELNQCFYVFDPKAHRLAKNLVLRKLEPKFYPGQHLEFLGEYGLWYYYLQTGDLESIRAVYDQTKTFLLETYTFGNPNTWFDWGVEIKDTEVIETCFFYIDLQALKKMALVTGHEADVPVIDAKLDTIKSTFDKKYWKGDGYRSSQVRRPDDRANAMAINAGLADKAKWNTIYEEVLSKKFYSSNFFDRWVFEALCTMGRQEYCLVRMYHRYKTMIPCSFTTLWEGYDRWWASRSDAFEDASSLNHGWNPPAIILSQRIAGVSPVEPGWKTYHVLPKEAFLTAINVVVPTIKGSVTVDLKKNPSAYSITLVSPSNTTAIVGIPKGSFTTLHSIKVNDVAVWNGQYTGGVDGVTWNGEDEEYVKFNVAPGAWTLIGAGILPITSPKPLPALPADDVALEKKTWTASASVPDSSFLFSGRKLSVDVSAANALDGDHWTGWRDMTKHQYAGQWFQVDMKQPQSFYKIVLDNTWALFDSPNMYAVSVSNDGITWGNPIATGAGNLGITTMTFPVQTARYIRITQTGVNALYNWSIYELDVFQDADAAFANYQPLKAPAPGPLLIKTGDRLAICGDSITEQKKYGRIIETYLTACVPELKVTVRQYGWSGETAEEFLSRMDNDCLRFKPTLATTCYGMNDYKYRPYDETNANWYRDCTTRIVKGFKEAGARVVLGSPGCVGKVASWVKSASGTLEEHNLHLCALRNIDIEIAAKEEVRFADVFWPMFTAAHAARQKYGADYNLAGADGVHPQWAGQLVMAYAFLKAMGLDGNLGTITLDLASGKAEATTGHVVDFFAKNEVVVTSHRYPFCATGVLNSDDSIRSGMRLVPFNQELNRLGLVVTGTTATTYTITWGTESRTYSAAQLAQGVNLAEDFQINPFSEAFAKVDAAVLAKQTYETQQVKKIFHGAEGKKDIEAAVKRTEAIREPLAAAIATAMIPVTHRIRIEAKE